MSDAAAIAPREIRVIGLIGGAHGFSHFYQLVLPMLFPALKREFDVDYTTLGAMMTAVWIVSGTGQMAAGFLVDRYGARTMLFGGLGLMAAAYILIAFAPGFWAVAPLALLVGVGNAVFHPADYSILNARVGAGRIGRAYSIHTFGGTIGWALAPLLVIGLADAIGWRPALLVLGAVGLAFLLLLMAFRHDLPDEGRISREAKGETVTPFPVRGLFALPILLCFAYFLATTVSIGPFQTYLPIILESHHGIALAVGGTALSTMMIASACGILLGGWIADRGVRPDAIVAGGLGVAAILVVAVGLYGAGGPDLFVLLALLGLCTGISTPSRDMLVRGAAPKEASGRVFGFVYSGLDTGAAIGPLVVTVLLDAQRTDLIFAFVAVVLALGIGTAFTVRSVGAARKAA
jgi:FSR family fosmidomycin resistance protein-like MFS transporter